MVQVLTGTGPSVSPPSGRVIGPTSGKTSASPDPGSACGSSATTSKATCGKATTRSREKSELSSKRKRKTDLAEPTQAGPPSPTCDATAPGGAKSMPSLGEDRLASLLAMAEQDIQRRECPASFYDQVMEIVTRYRDRLGREGVAASLSFLVDQGVIAPGDLPRVRRTVYLRLKKETQEQDTTHGESE